MMATPCSHFTVHATVQTKAGHARAGQLTTPRGNIDTPVFMPVGTLGNIKAMYPQHVEDTGARLILGNAYHLMLRPGAERLAELGGLHKFMNWPHSILTDSGGFQVMSLRDLRRISRQGVRFRSHIDGTYHTLTPEKSLEVQSLIGSDIHMIFDECPPFCATQQQVKDSMELSLHWAERSKVAFTRYHKKGQLLFGIVQGGVFETLRQQSIENLLPMGFDGMAIGGLAVGEGQEAMLKTLDVTVPRLPQHQPRYLMGVGRPEDLVEAVRRGIDMFDCVLPTRSGRHGLAYTRHGTLQLRQARYKEDMRPLDAHSSCHAANSYSRAYLHHLFKARETLAGMVVTWANVHYYQTLMQKLRTAIVQNTLEDFIASFYETMGQKIPNV